MTGNKSNPLLFAETRICKTCAHHRISKDSNNLRLACVRYPPIPYISSSMHEEPTVHMIVPSVDENWTCGEWKRLNF
jgi:hypothetical protein